MTKTDFLTLMGKTADELGSDRLTRDAFHAHTGVSRNEYAKHCDTWTDACVAAGLQPGLTIRHFAAKPHSKDECLRELRRVAALLVSTDLSSKTFTKHARFGSGVVIRAFGGWKAALQEAGLEPTAKSKKDSTPPTRADAISELKRVAQVLGQPYLTVKSYDKKARINSQRVVPLFGGWHKALEAAGLSVSPNFKREIPFEFLAGEFLRVTMELQRIPTLQQLTRRTKPVSHTYAGRFGGYSEFKNKAIDFILSSRSSSLSRNVIELLNSEMERIRAPQMAQDVGAENLAPHYQGRTLNFRSFVYSPTSEPDVVQMFGAIAYELGFEIIGNRSAFPDCEARRRVEAPRERYVKCLIEYEFSSSDYKRHKHPLQGCDLIVCWNHDWPQCPIEVFELSAVIKGLHGWR